MGLTTPACAVALLCLLAAASALAQASPVSERRFTFPKKRELVLQVPAAWNAQVREARRRGIQPPTVIFTPANGEPFKFLVTALFPKRRDEPPRSAEDDRAFVVQAAERAKGRAVDEELPILELDRGDGGWGYYFSSTDRIAQEGEFKYLTEGVLRVSGRVSLSFNILTNEGQEEVVKQALEVMRSAALEDAGG
jgi:hypothetical protein